MMVFDIYSRPFYFLMPDDSVYYRNYMGTFFGILTILTIVIYGMYKIQDLLSYNDYRLFDYKSHHFFKDTDNFTTNDGFHIAAGFVNLENNDPSSGLIEDPEVGTVKFFFKSWDIYDPVT